jgi:hypothetical protein
MRTTNGAPDDGRDIVATLRDHLETRTVEERLLPAIARLRLDEAAREHVLDLLSEGVEWPQFVAAAKAHAVAPLMCSALAQPPLSPVVPADVLSDLHRWYLLNSASNLLWQHELTRIVRGLSQDGISPVLLKGAALLHTVFPDPGLRQLRDLDLLVHPTELAAAERQLDQLGYAPAEKGWPPGTWPPDWYEKKYQQQGTAGWGAMVEIHWKLARGSAPLRIDVTELLQQAEPVLVDGRRARVLSPTHQIIHLCTHMAYNDGFGVGLSRPSDLYETIETFRPGLDWDRLASEARRFRASLCLRYALAVTSALFGMSLPPGFLENPSDPPLRPSLAVAALDRVLVNDHDPAPLPGTLAKLVTTDQIDSRAVLRFLLPRPRHLTHSYELLRPVRLLRALRYARSLQRP